MAKINETFAFGDPSEMDMESLVLQLRRMYRDLAVAVNKKPDVNFRKVAGTPTDGAATDTFLSDGDININLSSGKVEMVVAHTTPTNITWTQLSP